MESISGLAEWKEQDTNSLSQGVTNEQCRLAVDRQIKKETSAQESRQSAPKRRG